MNFKHLHPSVGLVYFTGLLILIFMNTHPIFLAVQGAGVLSLAFFYAGRKQTVRQVKPVLFLSVFIILINPLLVRRGATILFYLFGNPVTLEAFTFGVYQFSIIFTVIILFLSFNQIIDQPAFLYLTARWMPRTAFVIDMALHAVSRYQSRAVEIMGIQQTKGVSLRSGPFLSRLRVALRLFGAFTVRNLEEGMETAEVLKARDYGTARRTHYRLYKFAARDVLVLLLLTVMCVVVLTGFLLGMTPYSFYPRLMAPTLNPMGTGLWLICMVYTFFPLIFEGITVVVWRWVHHGN